MSVPELRWLLPLSLLLGGCAFVGPPSISSGRMAYNEVINYTGDQELLNMIVRERYGQTFGMLSVASVTASVKVRGSVGSELRAWGSRADTDDLVPLSIGFAYEESPTISYLPVQGELMLRRLVSPLTVEEGYHVLRAATDLRVAAHFLYVSINGLLNPRDRPASPEFVRLIDLYVGLRSGGVLSFGRIAATAKEGPQYAVKLHDYDGEYAEALREFLELLGFEGEVLDGRQILIPFVLSSGKRVDNAINVELRSALDCIRYAGARIEVPAEHLEEGIVEPLHSDPPEEWRFITIRSSKSRPENATVAISFRDWWFYVDATDARSKYSFKLIKFLVRLRSDLDSRQQQAPVLTVPVG